MGFIYHGIPKDLVLELKEAISCDYFVETGTYLGNTVIWAADYFKYNFTIEISKQISETASQRADAKANIQFLVGNSGDVLKRISSKLPNTCIFWLDGHYSGEGTGGEEQECPLMSELEAIKDKQGSVILIDDLRFFLGPPPDGHRSVDWPGIQEVIIKLNQLFPKHYVTLMDDVIVVCPNEFKDVVDRNWKKNFAIRYTKETKLPFYKRWLLNK